MKSINACFIFISVVLMSCSSSQNGSASMDSVDNKANTNITYPYQYVDTRQEIRKNDGSYNEMLLYTCGKNVNADTLTMFCKEKKDSFTDGYFHIITFFDTKKHAKFTEYPVTAMYGMDEVPAKYIKAQYEFNLMNGYSRLTIYEKNSWESTPKIFDVN